MAPEGETAQQMAKVTGLCNHPHDGEESQEETDAYLGYDQKNIYLVFVCFDNPEKVAGADSVREDINDMTRSRSCSIPFMTGGEPMKFHTTRWECSGMRS